MATRAKLAITVTSSRSASVVTISTNGKYISLPVNSINQRLTNQPVQPTASVEVFWLSVLAIVQAAITADE